MNHLYFGDCLDILKKLHSNNPQGFIDLIYIDPPFNSKRNYNVLFESIDLKDANAQKQAFADTWSNVSYIDTINELAELDKDLHTFLKTLSEIRISDSAVAYLSTMAIRIYYMHKVLKDTGSFYLHCDPTMSHYLKLICDLIFGEKNFLNEIGWKRSAAHSSANRYGCVHDIILFYSKSSEFVWNKLYQPYDEEYLETFFDQVDENGRKYQRVDLTGAGTTITGESGKKWRGIDVTNKGRHWAYSHQQMEQWEKEKKIHWPKKAGGMPRLKVYPEDKKGIVLQDLWNDIKPLHNLTSERLGYPTQKPEALLERIIKASTNEGDLVADFFCGCGTTVAAAQALNRKWLGCDISHLAVRLIGKRLVDTYGHGVKHTFNIEGFPMDVASAKELARNTDKGRFNFQEWVIEFLLLGVVNPKKVADGGYDGYLTFNVTEKEKHFVLIEVKSGNVNVKNIREFIQVIEHQKAAMGIFVCFEEQVTKEMLKAAKLAGNYHYGATGYESDFPKIQITTVEDLMHGYLPQMPRSNITTFKSAQKTKKEGQASLGLFD